MADKRTISVVMRAEMAQYRSEMKGAAKDTTAVGDAAKETGKRATDAGKGFDTPQWNKAGKTLLGIGLGMTAIGVATLKTGIAYNTLQQQSRAALATLLGSTEAANAQMDKLDEFARSSPFSKAVFIEAQQQMLAFGIEAQKVVPYLDAIQDAVAAAGGSNDDIAGIVATMSKIQSSAKVTAQDLNEFGNRGVDAAGLIGSQMGKTGAQIRTEITAGSLDATVALDALAAGMGEKFDGAAAGVKGTFIGAMDRVRAAFRDFASDLAEPFVSKNGGGIFVGLLNEIADLLRTFEALPGPVKNTISVLAALTTVAALTGGAFLVLAPRIVATRLAMESMARSAPGLTSRIGLLKNTIGGPLMIALTAATIAMGVWAKKSAEAAARQKEIQSAGSALTATLDKETGALTDQSRELIANELAQTGALEAARKLGIQTKLVTEAARGSWSAQRELTNQIDAYGEKSAGASLVADSLRGVLLRGGEAASASKREFDDAGVAIDQLGGESVDAAQSVDDLKEALDGLLEPLLSQDEAMVEWRNQLADLTKELSENGGTLDENTQKGRDNRDSIRDRVEALKASAEADLEAGGSQEEFSAKLIRGTEHIIDNAKAAGLSEKEVRAYLETLGLTPDQINTVIKADDKATPKLSAVHESIRALDGQSATVRVGVIGGALNTLAGIGDQIRNLPGYTEGHADGGYISGPGTSTSDSIPARLSNGEFVVRASATRNNLALLQAINAGKYARGGLVKPKAFAQGGYVSSAAASSVSPSVGAAIDYERLAAAISDRPILFEAALSVTGRQAGTLYAEGAKYVKGNS